MSNLSWGELEEFSFRICSGGGLEVCILPAAFKLIDPSMRGDRRLSVNLQPRYNPTLVPPAGCKFRPPFISLCAPAVPPKQPTHVTSTLMNQSLHASRLRKGPQEHIQVSTQKRLPHLRCLSISSQAPQFLAHLSP